MNSPFIRNEHGIWCPSCGERLSSPDEDFDTDGECPTCGFPDDTEKMVRFLSQFPLPERNNP